MVVCKTRTIAGAADEKSVGGLSFLTVFYYFWYMYSTTQIIKILKDKKPELQTRYPISELGLFGSYARGDFNENSDIDILVDFNGRVGIEFISLAHELEDIFHTKIDLVSRKGIKEKYLPFVEKHLIHVWKKCLSQHNSSRLFWNRQ